MIQTEIQEPPGQFLLKEILFFMWAENRETEILCFHCFQKVSQSPKSLCQSCTQALTDAFLGKVILMPCKQKHFYSTFIFVLRTETACVGLWEQCVTQHCHLSVCHHMPARAWCMLETQARVASMLQQTQGTTPLHCAQYVSF